MKKITLFKQIAASIVVASLLAGCATQGNQPAPGTNSMGMTKTETGALIGGILGAVVGASTKGNSKGKRVILGGAIGAAIGGGIGYSMEQQAKQVAQELETDVNNNPNAAMNPDNDLIVSKY